MGLTLALVLALPAAAQPFFTSPELLNTNAASDTRSDFSPEIATDGAANWVAVWHSWENLGGLVGTDYDIFVATSGDNGATWSAPQALNSSANVDTGSDTFPAIAVDSTGRWITVWQSTESAAIAPGAGTDTDIFFSMSTDDGLTWTAAQLLNTNGTVDSGGDNAPQIANEGAGDWVVVWHSNESGIGGAGSDADIFYSRSPTASVTWASPSLLNTGGATDSGFDHYPQIAFGAGTFVVAWHSNDNFGGTGLDSDVWVQTSSDGGQTWTPRYMVNDNGETDAGTDTYVQIAMDPSGTWIAVWNSTEDHGIFGTDYDIFTAMSFDGGATWQGPNVVNSNAIGDSDVDSNPRIVSSPRGGWVVTWYRQGGASGADGDIFGALLPNPGLSWTAAALFNDNGLTDSGQDLPPAIASDGNGHWVAAWQSYENLNGTAGTDADIFFASSDDIDGDGTPDTFDAFPLDCLETTDTDGDGIGNNADFDDDGDGLLDVWETNTGISTADPADTGTHPLIADTDGDGVLDGADRSPLDASDCRSANPQLQLVWGHSAPFGVEHRNDPGIGHRYRMNATTTLPGLASDDVRLPADLPGSLLSGLQALFDDARAYPPDPFFDYGLQVSTLTAADPLPAQGIPGSPSLLYIIDRSVLEDPVTDPDFGPLEGFAFTGVNRFNRNCRGGAGSVILDPEALPVSTDPGYSDHISNLVETIGHEAGHLYGLRHVLPDGLVACVGDPPVPGATPAVMDYYRDGSATEFANCSGTPGQGCPVTEPPDCTGEDTGEDHNPLYHYLHYVVGDSTADLAAAGITPGAWDQDTAPLVVWQLQFNFTLCLTCNDPNQVFYNFTLIEVLPSGARVVRAVFSEITLGEINGDPLAVPPIPPLTVRIAQGSGLMIEASAIEPTPADPNPASNVFLETVVYPPASQPPAPGTVVTSQLVRVVEGAGGTFTPEPLATATLTPSPAYVIQSGGVDDPADGVYEVADNGSPPSQLTASTYTCRECFPAMTVSDVVPSAASNQVVPEPGFGVGFGAGLAALLALGRRRPRV